MIISPVIWLAKRKYITNVAVCGDSDRTVGGRNLDIAPRRRRTWCEIVSLHI